MATFEHTQNERLAHLEALLEDFQPQLDRRFSEAEKLNDEKLRGLRHEVEARSDAQGEAVDKAEKAANARFETFLEQNERKADVTQQRLGALESITSSNQGAASGIQQYRSGLVSVISILATLVGGGLLVVVIKALGG